MPVITLSREMGSLGDDLATAVAQRLGLRLMGRELINRAAREAGAPEVALAEIDELGLLGVRPTSAAAHRYREKVAAVIRDLAAQGDIVLVGRAAHVVLAGQKGVLRVRVIAPRAERIARVQERCGVTPDAAAARVSACDRARAEHLRRYYGVRWDDPSLYDLVLNTGQLPLSLAVAVVCLAASELAEPAGQERSSREA